MPRAVRFTFIVSISILAVGWQVDRVQARNFRVSQMPNGFENGCSNCHFNPGGGGSRNDFGEDVNGLVSRGGQEEFWTSALALLDSDGDGFTNGEELGDPDGDGVPGRTVNISIPGIDGSTPAAALGDCNLDTVLDAADLTCVKGVEARDAVLTALSTLPGDLDGNGDVSFSDFLVLSGNFGTDLPAYADGNIDLTGSVDFADFLILSGNFGKSAGGALSSVPEPGNGLLSLLGFCSLLPLRKSRRRPRVPTASKPS